MKRKATSSPLTVRQQISLRKQLEWRAQGVSGKTKAQRRAEEAWRVAHKGDPMAGLEQRFAQFFRRPQ